MGRGSTAHETEALRRRVSELERENDALRRELAEHGRLGEERERLFETFERERSRLARVFMKAPAFIATLRGPEHVFEMANPAYEQLVGFRDILGKPVREALPEVSGQGFFELLDQVYATGEPYVGNEIPIYLGGEEGGPPEVRYVNFVYQPLAEHDGSVSGIFVHGFDVTEQVRARQRMEELVKERERAEEALREADRRKNEFLAMLGHELRNPLAPVRNAIYILRQPGVPQEERARARDIVDRQIAHLTRLVDDLLDLSRISRGKILLRRERLDLVALVRAATEDHRASLEANGLALEVVLPQQPLWTMGDPTRLSQVVGNLLHNAGKFTDAGGHVQVELKAEGLQAELAVRDTGIGMEPWMVERLFEAFSQADRSLDRSQGGLGLGLALVKGLIDLHGGEVHASSLGLGRGTELLIRLPIELPEKEMEMQGTGTADLAGGHRRILVIEDNHDAAESMQLLLELSGHTVTVAFDGPGGLEAAKRFQPEVVLCDIGLPGAMDGYAVARSLRSDGVPGLVTLIALTGYGQDEDQARAREAGFDIHLTKPVDPVALQKLLGELPGRG